MTKWQWSVIIALCKIILDMKYNWSELSDEEDFNLLHLAVARYDENNEMDKT